MFVRNGRLLRDIREYSASNEHCDWAFLRARNVRGFLDRVGGADRVARQLERFDFATLEHRNHLSALSAMLRFVAH